MGRTLARIIIFIVATFLMLYSISVAAISFSKLNITAFHLSQPLLIGYGVFWLIVAPSGLWGIFGSTQNNADLCNRYLRDHWFSSAVISTVDIIKIIFSFTMKNNSIQRCMNETPNEDCIKKVDLFQKAGLIAFGVQGLLMVGLGILVWYSCRQLMKKKDEKAKVELGYGLETQNTRQLNDDDTINLRVQSQSSSLDRVETNPHSSFTYRPYSNKGQKGQNEQKIKKDGENVVRSREEQGGTKNTNNVDVKNVDYNVNNVKNVNNNNNNNVRNVSNVNNVKNVQESDQKQQYTAPPRPRKSQDRQVTPDELQGYPPQGMNQTAPMGRSKSMAPPVRPMFPPPQPEYRFIPSIQYPQGVKGMQKSRGPIPPPYYYNRPPLPQFQQSSNFPPMYPWQQQWVGYNAGPPPPRGDFRGHRRSKSQPELRPLSFYPSSMDHQIPLNPPQIPKQQAIPSQIIERQQNNPIDSKNKNNNENKNNNNSQSTSAASSRRSSTSSRYRTSLLPGNEKRPYSQMHRTNSLPNLSNPEDLIRNEMLFAPPVPLIPSNLQSNTSNTKNNNKNNKSDNKNTQGSEPPIINNADKFERFIKLYGDKEYNMVPENPQYNKYSQYNNNDDSWNTNDDDYVPPKRQRPKSAQSVQGEASPKSSIYVDDFINRYYNDYYYYGPPLGYNNYVYPQYGGPIGYNNGGNFVQNNPMDYNSGRINYGQQRPQRMNYYY